MIVGVDEGSYDGQDLVVDGATLTVTGEHDFNSLWVINGGIVQHAAGNSAGMELTIADRVGVDRTSAISADGLGNQGRYRNSGLGPGAGGANDSYGRGGGYGGVGGLLPRGDGESRLRLIPRITPIGVIYILIRRISNTR